jgi:hypothetical protein
MSLEIALINIDFFPPKCCLCEIKTEHPLIVADVIYGKHLTLSSIVNGNSIHNPATYPDIFHIFAAILSTDERHRFFVRRFPFNILDLVPLGREYIKQRNTR